MNPIGTKQTVILLILAALTGGFYYYANIYLVPAQRTVKAQISAEQSEIATMQQEMTELEAGYNSFLEIQGQYDEVVNLGFFEDQNRIEAQKLIEIAQKKSNVLSAQYAIKPLRVERNDRALAVNYQLVGTDIDLTVKAIDDTDIYDFIFILTNGFPGHIEVKNVSIKRVAEVTQPLLRKIGSGDFTPVVEATINIRWRTLKEQEVEEVETQS